MASILTDVSEDLAASTLTVDRIVTDAGKDIQILRLPVNLRVDTWGRVVRRTAVSCSELMGLSTLP
jgi:hypothetical protein